MADQHSGLGELITSDKGRDAVHVAIAPVTATEKLHPGQGLVLVDGDPARVKAAVGEWIGIVDPFLMAAVFPEQRFWMWMRPGSITSLRHEWTHDALDTSKPDVAKEWMRAFADSVGDSYDFVMEGARDYLASYDPKHEYGGWDRRTLDAHKYEGISVPDEFWTHYETITGEKVVEGAKGHFFNCMGCS